MHPEIVKDSRGQAKGRHPEIVKGIPEGKQNKQSPRGKWWIWGLSILCDWSLGLGVDPRGVLWGKMHSEGWVGGKLLRILEH